MRLVRSVAHFVQLCPRIGNLGPFAPWDITQSRNNGAQRLVVEHFEACNTEAIQNPTAAFISEPATGAVHTQLGPKNTATECLC